MPLWSVDTSPPSGRSYLQSLQIGQGIIHAHGTHAWGQPLPPTPLWHVFHPFFCLMGQNTLTDSYILGHGLYLAQDGTCENQYRHRSESDVEETLSWSLLLLSYTLGKSLPRKASAPSVKWTRQSSCKLGRLWLESQLKVNYTLICGKTLRKSEKIYPAQVRSSMEQPQQEGLFLSSDARERYSKCFQ